jgi:hypothetical protein
MHNDKVIKSYIKNKFKSASNACSNDRDNLEKSLREKVKQSIHKFKVPLMDQIATLTSSEYTAQIKNNREFQLDTHIVLNEMHPSGNTQRKDLKQFLKAYQLKLNEFYTLKPEEVMNNLNALIREFEGLINLMKMGVTLTIVHKNQFQFVLNRYKTSYATWQKKDNDRVLGLAITELRKMCNKPEDPNQIDSFRYIIIRRYRGGKKALAAFDREFQAQQPA